MLNTRAVISARRTEDIPKESHWAIIKFSSIHIPGDERSRTNPGHGYPAHTEVTSNYYPYMDRHEWVSEIKKLVQQGRKDFVAIAVKPASIKTEVVVEVT